MTATAIVENQSSPLVDYNPYEGNRALREAVAREGAGWAHERLMSFGAQAGRAERIESAQLANRFTPVLRTHDRYGRRCDTVEFHPAWHDLMRFGIGAGLHSSPWADPRPGAHVARAAAFLTYGELENGTQCPMTMTYGSVPALSAEAGLAKTWLPKIFSTEYDPRFAPVDQKSSALIGMGMTEKQGGSDVRANTTRAHNTGGREFELTGHKWFMSAPMCDAFLVTAQTDGGLSCFFVPRFTPDGKVNTLRFQRLKDKLGNKSNASSEVEFESAWGVLLGEEGRGVPTILEMGVYTRLDCSLGSTGIMRQCLAQALHHARLRSSFKRTLREHPLMKSVLADLALEVEAATALSMRLARAYDRGGDETEREFRRVVTAISKYWICKRGIAVAAESMEVLGGNGYVEEAPLARLYREMPVNSIWEGSGNIMCLDVLRALSRGPAAYAVLAAEMGAAQGRHPAFDAHLKRLESLLKNPAQAEPQARVLVQALALALQASLLLRHAPTEVAETFCASRLGDSGWGACFGALPAGAPVDALIERAMPY